MLYFDTHCHLTSERFNDDLERVIADCREARVGMLTVAGSPDDCRRCVDLAQRHDGLWAAVGVHPCHIDQLDDHAWAGIERLARSPRVLAVGETGLDYYWRDTDPGMQKHWFLKHCALALETGKPVSIHARDSVPDMLDLVKPFLDDGLKAIWHCFTAGKRLIAQSLDFAVKNGLHLAVGGLVTFEDQKPLRQHAALIPDHLLLLETDSPYLAPRPKTSHRNTPAGVIRVAEELAVLRRSTPEAVAALTTENAARLLGSGGEPAVS